MYCIVLYRGRDWSTSQPSEHNRLPNHISGSDSSSCLDTRLQREWSGTAIHPTSQVQTKMSSVQRRIRARCTRIPLGCIHVEPVFRISSGCLIFTYVAAQHVEVANLILIRNTAGKYTAFKRNKWERRRGENANRTRKARDCRVIVEYQIHCSDRTAGHFSLIHT